MNLIAHGVEEVNEEFRFIKSHTGFQYVFVHPGNEIGLEEGRTLPVLSVSSDSLLIQNGEEKEQINAFDFAYGELLCPYMFVDESYSFVPGPGPYKVGKCVECQKENQPLTVSANCATACTPLENMNGYYSLKEVK